MNSETPNDGENSLHVGLNTSFSFTPIIPKKSELGYKLNNKHKPIKLQLWQQHLVINYPPTFKILAQHHGPVNKPYTETRCKSYFSRPSGPLKLNIIVTAFLKKWCYRLDVDMLFVCFFFIEVRGTTTASHTTGCLSSVHVDFFFLLFSSLFVFLLIDNMILAATRRTGIPLMGHPIKVSYFKLVIFYFENLYGPRQQRTQEIFLGCLLWTIWKFQILSSKVEF